jgi:putative NADH-flavin reductase
MKFTVFGATGTTGTHLVRQALTAGHQVTAAVRDPAKMKVKANPGLRIVTADAMDPTAVAPLVSGAEVVFSALGPPGKAPTTILRDSTHAIIQAMAATGATRLVTISGSMIDDTGDGPVLRHFGKPLARRILKEVCADMRDAEAQIHTSSLDWTIFRPPRLTDKPPVGKYRMAIDRNLPRGFTIPRADLATAMLEHVNDLNVIRAHVFVAT